MFNWMVLATALLYIGGGLVEGVKEKNWGKAVVFFCYGIASAILSWKGKG